MSYWLSFELVGYRQNRLAIDRIEWLSIEHNGYRWNRMAMGRKDWQSIEQNSYIFVVHHNIAIQIMTFHDILS